MHMEKHDVNEELKSKEVNTENTAKSHSNWSCDKCG